MVRFVSSLAFLALVANATALVQGDCVSGDPGLKWLASVMNKNSAISCKGQALQKSNAARFFGTQYSTAASVVVYPATKQDVSHAVVAAGKSPLGANFGFVGGAYGQSQEASGFVVDLSMLHAVQVVKNIKVADTKIPVAISYQGGATWKQVQAATKSSGYTAIGARVGEVGVGGFSTMGGTGFLTGAYGFASDRLVAVEVVQMSGAIVNATKTNEYSDLFWAIQGGGGQLGIVTTFYQTAAPAPKTVDLGFHIIDDAHVSQAQQNTVTFFNTNKDPYSLLFYVVGYIPSQITTGPFAIKTLLFTLRFSNPSSPSQPSYNKTFTPLLSNLNITSKLLQPSLPYSDMQDWIDAYFPLSFRRSHTGAQLSTLSTSYLSTATSQLTSHVNAMLAAGDDPRSTLWGLQYISPGVNGHLPSSDGDTAWPHSAVGHQSLFSPAWTKAGNDGKVAAAAAGFNALTRRAQGRTGKKALADNPGYMLSGAGGATTVYGANLQRLETVKQKYDPQCRIRSGGVVFGSAGCNSKAGVPSAY